MMRRIYTILICTCLVGCAGLAGMAQISTLKRANKYYERESYPLAARLYEQAISTGISDQPSIERLGACYFRTGQLEQAVKVWDALGQKVQDGRIAYDYGHALMGVGRYKEGAGMFDRYAEITKDYGVARALAEACERAEALRGDGMGWRVNITDLNSRASDIAAVMLGNKVVFASSRSRGFFSKVLNLRSDSYFYDLYSADIKGPLNFEKARLMRRALRSRYHDGPVVFSADGQVAYLTKSGQKGQRLDRDQQEWAHLRLHTATLQGKHYRALAPLPIELGDVSAGHLALAPDGSYAVFAAKAKGGKNGSELYRVRMVGNTWGQPELLGPHLNTSAEEMFPFIAYDHTLIFASTGHAGLGGLDLFYAHRKGDDWTLPLNFGAPVNSPRDDFAMYWDKRNLGYFSSNRPGGKGGDDIYHFSHQRPVELIVTNRATGQPIPDVAVVVTMASGKTQAMKTDAEGKLRYLAEAGGNSMVEASKQGYHPAREAVKPSGPIASATTVELKMTKFPVATVIATVRDAGTRAPLPGAELVLLRDESRHRLITDPAGSLAQAVDTAVLYYTITAKPGYKPQFGQLDTRSLSDDKEYDLSAALQPGAAKLLLGKTIEKGGNHVVTDVRVHALDDENGKVLAKEVSGQDGRFGFALDTARSTSLIASREGYFSARIRLGKPRLRDLGTELDSLTVVELVQAKVGELVKVIYYDYRMSEVTRSARQDLDEIVYFLQDNPSAVVELSAHTDARGSIEYNKTLSDERAGAAVRYIVSQGIAKDRISAKGYGETALANGCGDGVECTDVQHSQNRRTEIRVVAIR